MDFSGSEHAGSIEALGGEKRKAVRVWLLGGLRVSVGSRAITRDAWRLRKAAALVKLLALAPGHRMHRERSSKSTARSSWLRWYAPGRGRPFWRAENPRPPDEHSKRGWILQAAFISGLFTFFGALIGFLGLLYLARRSDRSTEWQLVHTRNRERREEASVDLSRPWRVHGA
jgi:hypothetical protein